MKKIEEVLEDEITRGDCETCPKNFEGSCIVTEEKIGSGDEYCALSPLGICGSSNEYEKSNQIIN